jgi:nucleoside-diphosphate-sugar epimerase
MNDVSDDRKYLVFGALGLVGRAVIEALDARGEQVIGVSRRTPNFATDAEFISLDLTDAAACERILGGIHDVSHIVFAALYEKNDLIAGWRDNEQIDINRRMLVNVLDHVEPTTHLTLLQGTKAYGAHLAPMLLPGKEHMPRHPGRNFYWEQEDLVIERSSSAPWTYSIMRPQIVCGTALGSAMNMVLAIGIYFSVMKALGEPCGFPGTTGFVTEATDAGLLANAILWCGNSEQTAGQTYNVTNGDVLDWNSIWPELLMIRTLLSTQWIN